MTVTLYRRLGEASSNPACALFDWFGKLKRIELEESMVNGCTVDDKYNVDVKSVFN